MHHLPSASQTPGKAITCHNNLGMNILIITSYCKILFTIASFPPSPVGMPRRTLLRSNDAIYSSIEVGWGNFPSPSERHSRASWMKGNWAVGNNVQPNTARLKCLSDSPGWTDSCDYPKFRDTLSLCDVMEWPMTSRIAPW
jgi:hypothetical protein